MSETGANPEKRSPGDVDPLVGRVLSGRFRLSRLIARGGMGKIYEATQEPLGRAVALKILDIHDAGAEFRRRFFLEAAHCAKLSHPNTVRIYDYGETDDGIYYIAMELLRGQTLHHVIEAGDPVAPARVVEIARQICSALAEAHDAGIIHRDLKPANVFLARHGEDPDFVKIVDFGLVKEMGKESELSTTGHVLGSPMYMAPEQVHSAHVDQRTDLYALGLILFALLTGRTAFKRGNPLAVLMAQASQPAPTFREANPDARVPASLEWLVQRCIEKRPDDRPASVHEVLRALKAIQKELRNETATLRLELRDGRIVLPPHLDVSEEIRPLPPPEVPLQAGGSTTLVQKPPATERSQRTRTIVLLGTTSVVAIGGGAALLVVGTLALAWALWGTSPPTGASVAPEPIVEEGAPEAPRLVAISVESEPVGAEVEREGVLLGVTPLTVRVPEGEAWIVEVSAVGHASRTVRLAPEQPRVTVGLEEAPSPRPREGASSAPVAPAPASSPTGGSTDPVEPSADDPVESPPTAPVDPAAAPTEPAGAPKRRGDIRNTWD